MLNDEKPMGVVYYINLKQIVNQRLSERIAEVDKKMEDTKQDMEYLQSIQDSLAQIELILGRMRELAEKSFLPGADRVKLSARMELLKTEIDKIAAKMPGNERFEEIRRMVNSLGLPGR